jgi:hypothetical protein
LILTLGISSCKGKTAVLADISTITSKSSDTTKLHKLKKLFVVGDFNGDGKQDTVFQHNYSKLKNLEIENSPDPLQNDWDTIVQWFYDVEANVFLTINITKQDTLHLGTAQGLYCLINIGDNNADGKDEIAFVIDYLDFSRVNSCKIYSLCNSKWTLLKKFQVHENSFDFTTDKPPVFDHIKGFLEKRNGKWVYKDFSQDDYTKQEDMVKMLKLKTSMCN